MSEADLQKSILAVLFIIVLLIGSMMVFFSIYPFKILDFMCCPEVEILNPDKRVPLGGVLHLKIRYKKYWSMNEIVIKALTITEIDTITGKTRELVLDSVTSVTDAPVGEHDYYSVYQLTYGSGVAGRDRKIVITFNYSMVGGRFIIRKAVSEPFEVYIPEGLPEAFKIMHNWETLQGK